jgi:hypothetical protein
MLFLDAVEDGGELRAVDEGHASGCGLSVHRRGAIVMGSTMVSVPKPSVNVATTV